MTRVNGTSTAIDFSEAETQALIASLELNRAVKAATPGNLAGFAGYFRQYRVDWSDALADLTARGLLVLGPRSYDLTDRGMACAERLCRERPRMYYWYGAYYEATHTSKAYAAFCERVFGKNLTQHGFSDMAQLASLLEATALGPGNRALDLGCGNGSMAEYISDRTGAHVTGIDYIPEAIRQARERTQSKRHRLAFRVMDIARIEFPPCSFDTLISIDTLYFTDLDETVRQMRALLKPVGQMGIFYANGASPETPIEVFQRDTLPASRTPLAQALRKNGLRFRTWDFTQQDYEHARLKKRVLEELRVAFEEEGNLFLYENRYGEARGVMEAIEANAHARYLYHVTDPQGV